MSVNNEDLPVPGKTLGELAAEASGEPSVDPVPVTEDAIRAETDEVAESAEVAEASEVLAGDLDADPASDDSDASDDYERDEEEVEVLSENATEELVDDYTDEHDDGPDIDIEGAAPSPGRGIRLQRYLAACGLGSRRECEQLITDGRITIDGETATVLGTRVDPQTQRVDFDGEPLKMERKKYYLLNKPSHYICTHSDPQGRPRVIDLFPNFGPRLFTVGRLDENTTGLLLVTNDGDLAQKLAHPKYRIYRYYKVQVAGQPDREVFDQLREGLYFTEGKFRVHAIKPIRKVGQSTWLEVTMTEGQNREIRRLFARVGHKVMKLERIGYGPLRIGRLLPGQYRDLTRNELAELHSILQRNMDGDAPTDVMAEDDGFDDAPRGRKPGGRKPGGRFDSDRGPRSSQDRRPQGGSGRFGRSTPRDESGEDRPRRPRGEGGYEDRPRRPRGEGGYEDRPRRPRGEGGYEDRPRRPRGEGGYEDRPRRPRGEGGYEDRPRRPRGEGGYEDHPRRPRGEGGYEDRPRRPRGEGGGSFSGERRSEGGYGDRPRRPRGEEGGREDRPRRPRGEGGYEDRPRRPRGEGGYEDRPRRPRGEGGGRFSGERRNEGGYEDRPRRPRGEGGEDRPRRPRGEGGGRFSGERRSEGGYGDRPRRPRGEGRDREDRPRRPRGEGGGRFSGERRNEGGYEDRPRRPRGEGGEDRPRRPKGSGGRFSGGGRSEGGDRPQRPFKGKRPGGPRSDRPKGKRPRHDD